jgi:hypothetical protein
MNLFNQIISTYSNFNFNSIACFNGTYLGATDTEIYPLGGDTDNGSDIDSRIKSGSMDFGNTFMKYAKDVWITHRTSGILRLIIYVDEDSTTTIEKRTTIINSNMTEERLKPPRGLKGRFYTVELRNVGGADFDIDSLGLLVESIKRKVR